jgi:hypothetical protein
MPSWFSKKPTQDKQIEAAVERALGPLRDTLQDLFASPQKNEKGWPHALDTPHNFFWSMTPKKLPSKAYSVDQIRAWAKWDPIVAVHEYIKGELENIELQWVAKAGIEDDVAGEIMEMRAWIGDDGPLGGAETRRVFEAKFVSDLLTVGAFAIWHQRTAAGIPLASYAIDAGTIKPVIDTSGWINQETPYEQWVYGAKVARFLPGELYYTGLIPDTYTPYFKSMTELAIERVLTGLKMDEWNLTWLTEGNVKTGDTIALPENMGFEDIQKFITMWNAATSAGARQSTMFLPSGSSKIADHSRKDQDFAEFETQTIRRICAVFGIQPASIGYAGEQYKVTQGDSMEASRRVGVNRIDKIRCEYYTWLAGQLGYKRIQCKGLQEDLDKQVKLASLGVTECGGAYKTINEVRAERGQAPIEGGDTLPQLASKPEDTQMGEPSKEEPEDEDPKETEDVT